MATEPLEKLKVHRRAVVLDGLGYTLLSPRPGSPCRFATHHAGKAWSVVTDVSGARVLGRLIWAMAFQRHERTVVVVDLPFLVPDPFDGASSSPIIIVNNDLDNLSPAGAVDLRAGLPFTGPSDGTVVLQTRGLDSALADRAGFEERETEAGWPWNEEQRHRIEEINGLVVVAAPAPILRRWGVGVSSLGEGVSWPLSTGEVQVLADFPEPGLEEGRSEQESRSPE